MHFTSEEERQKALRRIEELREYIKDHQAKSLELAKRMAKRRHPFKDWLDLTARQRNHYYAEAKSRLYWESRNNGL